MTRGRRDRKWHREKRRSQGWQRCTTGTRGPPEFQDRCRCDDHRRYGRTQDRHRGSYLGSRSTEDRKPLREKRCGHRVAECRLGDRSSYRLQHALRLPGRHLIRREVRRCNHAREVAVRNTLSERGVVVRLRIESLTLRLKPSRSPLRISDPRSPGLRRRRERVEGLPEP